MDFKMDSWTSMLGYLLGSWALVLAQGALHHLLRRMAPVQRYRGADAAEGPAPGRLRVLQLNAWSGSKYTGELALRSYFSFTSYETKQQREDRYGVLVREVRRLDPDVIALQEAMPSAAFTARLAQDLGMDWVARDAVAGLVCGWLRFPFISEGDGVLAKPALAMEFGGRARLSGTVFSDSFSLNFDDASQVLAVRLECVRRRGALETPVGVSLCCTHWHASVIDDIPTREQLAQLSQGRRSPEGIERAGMRAIAHGTTVRCQEASKTLKFVMGAPEGVGALPTILAGDLNTVAGTPEMLLLNAGGFASVDGSLGPTWDPANPNVAMQAEVERGEALNAVEHAMYSAFAGRATKLDHVLVRAAPSIASLHARKCRRVLDGAGGTGGAGGGLASDHYGILIDFDVV